MKPLESIQTKTLIVKMIREEIFSGRMKNNEEIVQEQLAEKLSLSRMPVREALYTLEQDGLLLRLPNRHMQVKGISNVGIKQFFSVLTSVVCEMYRIIFADEIKLSFVQNGMKEFNEELKTAQSLRDCISHEVNSHLLLGTQLENLFLRKMLENLITGFFCFAIKTFERDKTVVQEYVNTILEALLEKKFDVLETTLRAYFMDVAKAAIEGGNYDES